MKLNFKYDLEKDIENFIKSSKSKNNKKPTPVMEEYITEYGEGFNEGSLRSFILSNTKKIDIKRKLQEIKSNWSKIENDFILISDKIFNTHLSFEEITVYLTINSRCTYNISGKYFFTNLSNSDAANRIIMHELLHFYTWESFGYLLRDENKITKEKYNDIKEALTVLLNIEYVALMNGIIDKGYPQHQELREVIKNEWVKTKDLNQVLKKVL